MVTPALVVGGMEVFIERLSLALRDRGHDVGVTCLYDRGPIFHRLQAAGVDVELVPVPGTVRTVWPSRLVSRFLRRGAGVVHAHSGSWLKASVAARLAKCRTTILTHHGLMGNEGWYQHWHLRQAARLASVTVAVSDPLRDYLHTRAGVPEAHLLHVPNGVALPHFARTPDRAARARQSLGLPPDAVVVATVARLVAVKRHDLLLDAMARLAARHPTLHLLIAGDGPERLALETIAARILPTGRVRFLGEVDDARPVLWSSDLFTLCSDSEGQPMALLEAMAAGCAVVVTRVGGMPDTLGPSGGLLVPPGDPRAIAETLGALVDDPPRRAALATAAVTRCAAFSFDVTVGRYEALYAGA